MGTAGTWHRPSWWNPTAKARPQSNLKVNPNGPGKPGPFLFFGGKKGGGVKRGKERIRPCSTTGGCRAFGSGWLIRKRDKAKTRRQCGEGTLLLAGRAHSGAKWEAAGKRRTSRSTSPRDQPRCHESSPSKIRGSKKIVPEKDIGSVGGRTFQSGNGAPCGKTTVPAERHGNIFRTITQGRGRTGGEKTASRGSATGTR